MAVEQLQAIDGFGDAADKLIANDFDFGILRPWVGRDGRHYVTKLVYNEKTGVKEPKVLVTNAPATLSKEAWLQFDNAIVKAVFSRLNAFSDIRAAGLEYDLPGGMAHTMLQYQTRGDITGATVSMDPIRRSEGDRPQMDLANFPLPVVHKDFDFSAREIMASRQGTMPLDTTTAELAAIKVAEEIEKMTVGVAGSIYSYGGASIYGYTTAPFRLTKTDMPVPDGTNGPAVLSAILTLRQMLIDAKHFGPFRMYVNSQWTIWLDTDFATAKGDQTLRQRILAVADIVDIKTLDFLPTTKYEMLLVEMKAQNVRAVIGLEVQTIQWESMGGFMKHFKVMALQLPQIRPDTAGTSGVAHGKTP